MGVAVAVVMAVGESTNGIDVEEWVSVGTVIT
jgi:hypothetical protein